MNSHIKNIILGVFHNCNNFAELPLVLQNWRRQVHDFCGAGNVNIFKNIVIGTLCFISSALGQINSGKKLFTLLGFIENYCMFYICILKMEKNFFFKYFNFYLWLCHYIYIYYLS